jgi:hypothetical protein
MLLHGRLANELLQMFEERGHMQRLQAAEFR